jgi:hypothetical protein
MTGRKLFSAFAALALSLSLAAGPALAKKPCVPVGPKKKSCVNEIKGCARAVALCYDPSVKGKVRVACIRDKCKTPIIAACKAPEGPGTGPSVCSASPSGAFLDVALE